MQKKRILVVDDELDQVFIMKTILEEHGFEVLSAGNADAARRLLASEVPDLIITDIMMPDESGFLLLSHIRRNPGLKATPVIVTSSIEAETQVFKQGGDAFISKPVESHRLLLLINDLVSRTDYSQLVRRGIACLKAGDYPAAEEAFRTVLGSADDGTTAAFAAYYLGEMQREIGLTDEAAACYKSAVQKDSRFWRAYNRLGELARERKDVRRAIAYFRQSLGINDRQEELAATVSGLTREMEA